MAEIPSCKSFSIWITYSLIILILIFINTNSNVNAWHEDVRDYMWTFEEKYFVDKSEMLRLLFDEKYSDLGPYHFICTPIVFGHTINLQLIRFFTEIELDKRGNPLKWYETEAYRHFKNLDIGKYENIMEKHMARYPVISILLFVHSARNEDDVNLELNCHIRDSLINYKYMKHHAGPIIGQAELKFLKKLMKGGLTLKELETVIFRLCRIFYTYFNSKVILLIDGYDKATRGAIALLKTDGAMYYGIVNKAIKQALTEGSEYVEKAIIFSGGTMGWSLIQPELPFVKFHAFLDEHPFSPYFGFTEEDLTRLFDLYECADEEKTAVRKYYKGYETVEKHRVLYCPTSIGEYFQHRDPIKPEPSRMRNYWANNPPDPTLTIAPYMRLSSFRHVIIELMDHESVELPLKKMHHPQALQEMTFVKLSEFVDIEERHLGTLLTLIFEQGFLSHGYGNNTYVIPNEEVKAICRRELILYQKNHG